MFKVLLSIAIALGVAAVAYGAAAQLVVNNGVVQYGADEDLTCVAELSASATTVTALDDTVDFISVNDLASCAGQNIRIGLTGGGGPAEWYNGPISGGVSCSGGTALCFAKNNPDASTWTAENLTDIHITLYSY